MNIRSLLFLPVLLSTAVTALADEVKLKDGRVLYGKVAYEGDVVVITTRDGVVRVAKNEIDGDVKPEKDLRDDLRRLEKSAGDTPFAHLQMATMARTWALEDDMWRHLDQAALLPRRGEPTTLRGRIDDFLAQLEPELLPRKSRAAATNVRVHELLGRLKADSKPGLRAAVEELLVREGNADKELRTEARGNPEAARRLCALEALLRRGTRGNDTFLLRTAVLDASPDVRARSMELARQYVDTDMAVNYMAPGLMHEIADVRVRTAEAYGKLANPAAVKLLVAAGPNAGKALADADPGVRAHVAFLEQQAYIRDFNVEVAQASFIADPVVDVLQSGVVLDATVHAVVTHRVRIVNAMRNALLRLAGSDPGPNPAKWASWLLERDGSSPQAAPAVPAPAPTTPRKNQVRPG